MSKKIVILGGIGNGSVIANAILDANQRGDREWECVGYLNDRIGAGKQIESFPVLGDLHSWEKCVARDCFFINTILRIDGQQERIELFESLRIPDERLATFIHPMAYVAPNARLGPGTVVMPNVSISSAAWIAKGCLIMVGASIGHDNKIGKYCHFAAQCCVGAYVSIGDGVHVGLNATIRENLTIGNYATIGMGAVLTKNVNENEIWVGNPARPLRTAN